MSRFTLSVGALAGLVILGAGCRPAADDHGHEHGEPKTAQITVWTDRYEVFAEHRAPVTGQATTFITHITDLHTLEPRREGMVKFMLRQGDTLAEHPQAAPARPGIYLPGIIFPKPGDWELALLVPDAGTNATVELGRVTVYADDDAAAHAEIPDGPEGVSFLKEQQWKVQAGTEPVAKRRLVEHLRLPATVQARPGNLAQVASPVAGRLALPPGKSMPLVGDPVEAGQVLALIQPSFSEVGARFVEAEGEVVRARLALEQANLTFQRIQKLVQAEARSGRELQEADFALKTAQARYDAALALQATYRQVGNTKDAPERGTNQPAIELPSPIAGTIIAQSDVAVGGYVTGEKALFTVLDAATVFIEARIPEASVRRLGETKAASYELPGESGRFVAITGSGTGRLVFVGIQVDPATRTVPLVYEVENPNRRLRIGQAVTLFVETARAETTLAIPASAIIEEDGRPVAFVQVSGETFEKRDLALGIRDGTWVQVLDGLTEGERVVTRGAYAVRLASVSSAIPAHGHVH